MPTNMQEKAQRKQTPEMNEAHARTVTSRPTYTSRVITGHLGKPLMARTPVTTWLINAHLFTRTPRGRALVYIYTDTVAHRQATL